MCAKAGAENDDFQMEHAAWPIIRLGVGDYCLFPLLCRSGSLSATTLGGAVVLLRLSYQGSHVPKLHATHRALMHWQ